MYDKPQVAVAGPSETDLVAWSSGSAAAVGISNGPSQPRSVCVLGAAFARTGSTDAGVSVVLPKDKIDARSATTGDAVVLKNQGQTATFLDTGMFHLCVMYAQAWIKDEASRVKLLSDLMAASVQVSKTAVQFAPVAGQQDPKAPDGDAKPAPDKPADPKPGAGAATPKPSSRSAAPAADVKQDDINSRIMQNTPK